jgi:hypothetical protein
LRLTFALRMLASFNAPLIGEARMGGKGRIPAPEIDPEHADFLPPLVTGTHAAYVEARHEGRT